MTATVGVTAGGVGDNVGEDVAPGTGVLRSDPDVTVLPGTVLRSRVLVAPTRGVFPRGSTGLARQGLGGRVGVTSTVAVAVAGGAVAVINTGLLTRTSCPPGRPWASSDPQMLPTVTKSRDILIQRQKKVTIITIRRPLAPRFHRAINV